MAHLFSQECGFCGEWTESTRHDIDRRIERVTVVRHDGKPVTQITIISSEMIHAYCDEDCWAAAEPDLAEELGAQSTYPPFGFVSSCCRCGASVDRTHDYVCYSIAAMSYSSDGAPQAECLHQRDWMVVCKSCEPPDPAETVSKVGDIEVPEREAQ